jgi:3-oxoacyl-[acyl-carrier-protein] synthase-1
MPRGRRCAAGGAGWRRALSRACELDTWIGEVAAVDAEKLPEALTEYDCRNNRLTQMGLETDGFAERVREGKRPLWQDAGRQSSSAPAPPASCRPSWPIAGAIRRPARCPTISIYRTTHNSFSLAEFARDYFGLEGPAMAISTACSSSAKVFAAAARQLACGSIDAALVGGVDSLCLTTLYGFASLQLTSATPCRPCDAGARRHFDRRGRRLRAARTGCRSPASRRAAPARHRRIERRLSHVVAAPGRARRPLAMAAALRSAGLSPEDIDYINLHGTATPANDAAEGKAVGALFGDRVPCSSTKGATGHTLGAAGAVEAVDLRAGPEQRSAARQPEYRDARPGIPVDYLLQSRPGRVAPCAEQFLRLRRQQLQPDSRSGAPGAP